MLNRIVSFFSGWYGLRSAEGAGADFINALNSSGVYFWHVRKQDGVVRARVTVFGYKRALDALRGAGEMESAHGLPFIIYRYRKRAGLMIGALLGLLLMLLSTLFAWEIAITGNVYVGENEILAALDSLGVKSGSFIPRVNVTEVNARLVSVIPDLSSASLHIDGNVICVDVIERVRPPERADHTGVYDVVASRDGFVTKIESYSGRAAVKPGDAVQKGQVLINGVYTAGEDPCVEMAVHARGAVYALYYKDFVYSVPLVFRYREYTGRTDEKTVYNVLGREIKTFLGDPFPFEHFEAEYRTERLHIGPLKTPVLKTVIYMREYVYGAAELTVETAKENALAAFEAWCANDLEGRLESADYTIEYDEEANCVTIRGTAAITADIAEERERTVP